MKTEIVVLSLACCSPAMKKFDDQLFENLHEAAKQVDIFAEIKFLSAVDVFAYGQIDNDYIKQVIPLAQKYGPGVAPLIFIDGKLEFYGGIPSIGKIVRILNNKTKKEAYL